MPPLARPALALAALLACGPGPEGQVPSPAPARPREPAADPAAVARGRELLTTFECVRCHDGDVLPAPPPRERDCVRCHQAVLAGTFEADPVVLHEWQQHIHHLVEVPQLRGLARLRRDRLAAWLHAPHDLRPNLDTTMPRLRLAEADAAALAAVLVPDAEPPAPEPGDPVRGRVLLARHGCMTCHLFTGVPPIDVEPPSTVVPADLLPRATAQAPDLRHTRDRLRPAGLHAWLADPDSVKPGTLMPRFTLADADVRDLAAYLLTADLTPTPEPVLPTRLPLLDRRVTFAEVDARIFKKTCWHCHSDPDYARGDGGPGNSGGFGYPPRRLDLASYAGVAGGSLGPDNQRRSIFKKIPFTKNDEIPRIVAHLLARHHEVLGRPDPELRGMPLGLTPVPLEDIQLLDTWIAQGRPE